MGQWHKVGTAIEYGANGASRTVMATYPDHEAALTVQVLSLTQNFS
jgi:hypothetical protein